jgi:hypothetical protein
VNPQAPVNASVCNASSGSATALRHVLALYAMHMYAMLMYAMRMYATWCDHSVVCGFGPCFGIYQKYTTLPCSCHALSRVHRIPCSHEAPYWRSLAEPTKRQYSALTCSGTAFSVPCGFGPLAAPNCCCHSPAAYIVANNCSPEAQQPLPRGQWLAPGRSQRRRWRGGACAVPQQPRGVPSLGRAVVGR